MTKNPKWTRDELILALELYIRVNPVHTSDKNSEIIELSKILNSLPIHPHADQSEKFRNPNGVYMKLCNFLRLDPNYKGAGLQRGGKLEESIWNEFFKDQVQLKATAAAIRMSAAFIPPPIDKDEVAMDEEEEFAEGRLLTQLHKRRERNPKVVHKKKKKVLDTTGSLSCEVCNFDFHVAYGILGFGFADCHHRKPLSELIESKATSMGDLAIVCANCHRMLHRARPWKTIDELKELLKL
jgi:5-methylcytosine-specific restriction enzyme A